MQKENKNLENQKEAEKARKALIRMGLVEKGKKMGIQEKKEEIKVNVMEIIGWVLVIGNGAVSILLYCLDRDIDTMTSGIIYYSYTRALGFPLIILGLFLIYLGKARRSRNSSSK